MQYNEKVETLDEFYKAIYSIPPRLTRRKASPKDVTNRLLKSLDTPYNELKSILITGSKGKGSSAIILSELLKGAGNKVGLFSSPHLFDYRERILVDRRKIDTNSLLKLANFVFSYANKLKINHPDEFPRFFEITTVIAYLFFIERKVDYAVIESGIGSQTDATNQNSHCLSVITNIEREHLDIFGSLKSLAIEKSGVIRKNTPLILGDIAEEIEQLILDKASKFNAPVTRFKESYIINNNDFYSVKIGEQSWITGSKTKAKNTWLSLQAFNKLGEKLADREMLDILKNIKIPAREEIISKEPLIIIDSAHTQMSAISLSNYVKKLAPNPIKNKRLLVSFSVKKNIMAVLGAFPQIDELIITKASGSRSLEVESIKKEILYSFTKAPKINTIKSPLTAIKTAVRRLGKSDILIITGSVYLAGLASNYFNNK